ncbi:GNAT family N-acetyltransferase [Bdellovibrio sp. HCB2-146]|uniref:GNAT family N-acetyltransferase n=1 Tax=Bdellovibrio sp. HCB2-146 TaxID=3394362 RepID=UPI0039BD4AD3
MAFLETDRLILRLWRPEDLDPFAALCADPEVMEYFPAPLTREETAAMIGRMVEMHKKDGLCFMACDRKDTGEFIGFVGLKMSDIIHDDQFAPSFEIGWRLARKHWGEGFAPEAARAVLHYAFDVLKAPEVVAMTAVENLKSRKVMEKIGMTYNPKDDFDHPSVEAGHPLRRHVLYRIKPGQIK